MAYDAETPRLTLRGKRVVLLLQGSGALGAYQVGPFGALAAACREASIPVAWVGGVSIGAIIAPKYANWMFTAFTPWVNQISSGRASSIRCATHGSRNGRGRWRQAN